MAYEQNTDRVLKSVETAKAEAGEKLSELQREAGEVKRSVVDATNELAGQVNAKLKEAGVDTEVLASAAKEQVTELQRLIGDELRARPVRALGIAAAVGFVFGILTVR